MAKKPDPFHNPFKGLKLEKEPAKKPAGRAPPPPPKPAPEDDEAALFRRAIGGVERVRKGPALAPPAAPPTADSIRIRTEEEDALEELALLVAGDRPFDLAASDEFIEGHVPGLDVRLLDRLRKGDYALQGHLDLHGLVRTEAKEALERFVLASRRAGKRCVLIVHGRGLHSRDQLPVLKESLQVWLSRGRVAREVLAFCTARSADGGAGAVYVLLRR